MEQTAGTPPGINQLQPLNRPKPIEVKADPGGYPTSVHLDRWFKVACAEETWRIDDEWWWETSISRLYFRLLLSNGRKITVFHDLVTDRWYWQEYV